MVFDWLNGQKKRQTIFYERIQVLFYYAKNRLKKKSKEINGVYTVATV